MPTTINITVEKRGNNTYTTPQVTGIDPNHIKLVQPEFTDAFVDRAMIQYYDNQNMTMIPFVTTETVDAIRVLANAAATDAILYYKVISQINRRPLGKLCLLNTNDGIVQAPPEIGNNPIRATYDFGERNHAKHVELDYCSYPLTVVDVSVTDASITLACCVDHFLICGTSISVGGSPYTVLSSTCVGNVGILVLDTVAGITIGELVQLT